VSKKLRPTAVHEAGHAVVGRVLGLPCREATIVANVNLREAGYSITANPYEVCQHSERMLRSTTVEWKAVMERKTLKAHELDALL